MCEVRASWFWRVRVCSDTGLLSFWRNDGPPQLAVPPPIDELAPPTPRPVLFRDAPGLKLPRPALLASLGGDLNEEDLKEAAKGSGGRECVLHDGM